MNRSILLCDDELHILRTAEFKFKRAGYEVRCAWTGPKSIAEILKSKPDIVVTDCQMPNLTGIELAAELQSNPETADLPIVMLTAKGFELSAEELRNDYGILALLAKPFSPRSLLKHVERILDEHAVAEHSVA